jgi:hypothetical protein
MKYQKILIALVGVLLLMAWGCERKTTTTNEIIKEVSPASAAHIGSAECGTCHSAIYASFQKTGHPYKLNEAEDVQQPDYYPFSSVPNPPAGVSWADVDKVIGGFRWKARFIGHDGFIITGSDVQYNLVDGSWTAYHDGETKPYACGPCHMTDYKSTGNQEGKEGLVGTWEFNGVQCEECHGPGELHAANPYDLAMVVDRSTEQCGKCHIRGDETEIPASGGFIRHHEQWNEMFTTKHAALKCIDCHDVHVSLHPNNPDRQTAIKVTCEGCHLDETESFNNSGINHAGSSVGPECIDCHMARATKSALAAGPFEGDVRTHLFRINTDANAEMFTPDGSLANGYLTLEYTCLTCHDSKDKDWAATYAGSVHAETPNTSSYVGSEACAACHQTKYDSFIKTGHPYKLNEAEDIAPDTGYYPYTSVPNPPAGVAWADVDKVIGGFWWKARFIGHDGFIITGSDVQYNLVDGSFTAYHDGEVLPYNCGPCHMTDYKPIGNQEDKEGLVGTWEFNGIQCEECHGPGEKHIADAYNVKMIVDRTSEQCGKCHIRGDVSKIPASGAFVKHHEQWNEMFGTKHNALSCIDCHEPHIGLHPDNPDRASAIKVQCENCHIKESNTFVASDLPHDALTCNDCHMPKGAKSALAAGTYVGDVTSHLWRINLDPDAEYITNDFANGYLTVEYSCLKCHEDKTKGWALTNATRSHAASLVEADGFNGGQLYDKFWMSETGFSAARQDTAFTNNADFYRCKGCHGWDLKGSAGAYINRGPTATRPNVSSIDLFAVAQSVSADSLFIAIKNNSGRKLGEPLTDSHPNYSEILTNREVWDIVKYLKQTRIDVSSLYQLNTIGTYPTGSFTFSDMGRTGDATRGDAIYADNCGNTGCHGADGTGIDIGGRSVGEFLRDKAYEMQHKVRYGQLGTDMGAGFPYLSITDLQDLYKALDNAVSYPDGAPGIGADLVSSH